MPRKASERKEGETEAEYQARLKRNEASRKSKAKKKGAKEEPKEEDKETKETKPQTFKDIYLTFLRNVRNGEPAIHSNRILKHADNNEMYHAWESTRSYPVVSTVPYGRAFTEIEADYDPSKPNTTRTSQIRMELGWSIPDFPPHWIADEDLRPLTPISVLIVGFDKRIGRMSPKDALDEAIRVLERTEVKKPEDALIGPDYSMKAVETFAEERLRSELPEIFAKIPDYARMDWLKSRLNSEEKLRAYLKHKKVRGITSKTKTDTLKSKLVLPTEADVDILVKIEDRKRPYAEFTTPSFVRTAMERLNKKGLGLALKGGMDSPLAKALKSKQFATGSFIQMAARNVDEMIQRFNEETDPEMREVLRDYINEVKKDAREGVKQRIADFNKLAEELERKEFATAQSKGKTGKGKNVMIPKTEFVKEHKDLVRILTKGTRKEQRQEAAKQSKELRGGVRRIRVLQALYGLHPDQVETMEELDRTIGLSNNALVNIAEQYQATNRGPGGRGDYVPPANVPAPPPNRNNPPGRQGGGLSFSRPRKVAPAPPPRRPPPPPPPKTEAERQAEIEAMRKEYAERSNAEADVRLEGEGKSLHLLELFKGTGSVGKVARKMGMNVTSVDLDPYYTPDIETDILKWDYKKWAKSNPTPDLIWASPPCNTFSPLAYPLKERDTKTAVPKSERARLGTRILYRTLEIIRFFQRKNPNLLYCIENPRGMMRNDAKMKALPHRDTTLYCLYNDKRRKPTDFWNNLEDGLGLKAPDVSKCKETVGVVDLPLDKRYAIPSALVRKILTAMKEEYTSLRGGGLLDESFKADEKAAVDKNIELLGYLAHFYTNRDPATALGFRVVRDEMYKQRPTLDGRPARKGDKAHEDTTKFLGMSVLGRNPYNKFFQPTPAQRVEVEVAPLVVKAQDPKNPLNLRPKSGRFGWDVPPKTFGDAVNALTLRPDVKGESLY